MKSHLWLGDVFHDIMDNCECMLLGEKKLDVIIPSHCDGNPFVVVVKVSVVSMIMYNASGFIEVCPQDNFPRKP